MARKALGGAYLSLQAAHMRLGVWPESEQCLRLVFPQTLLLDTTSWALLQLGELKLVD